MKEVYISRVSIVLCVLSQRNTQLRLLYFLNNGTKSKAPFVQGSYSMTFHDLFHDFFLVFHDLNFIRCFQKLSKSTLFSDIFWLSITNNKTPCLSGPEKLQYFNSMTFQVFHDPYEPWCTLKFHPINKLLWTYSIIFITHWFCCIVFHILK